jgi:RNA polymerase sigma factor (sigma-70 family)
MEQATYTLSHDPAPIPTAEFDQVLRMADGLVRRWLRRLPPDVDEGAYSGEGWLAVLEASFEYRGDGLSFPRYACQRVMLALKSEARRQDPLSRSRRRQLRLRQVTERPADLPPLSLEALRDGDASGQAAKATDVAPGPEALVVATDESERILAALRTLDERAQQILWLHFWEEWSLSRIARLLGLDKSRVSRLARRALDEMRTLLGPEDAMPPGREKDLAKRVNDRAN